MRRSLALCALLSVASCRRKHIPVTSVPQIPYPSCDAGDPGPGAVLASGRLRAGPNAVEQSVVERYELRQRACLRVMTVRQEWPLNVADVEVVYDEDLLPLRAWKRMTLPGVRTADGQADIRLYELRTPEVTITRRARGARTYEVLRGPRPTVVIGPGRGILTAWIRRAHLAVGASVREYALDMRAMLETLAPVTLRRDPDLEVPALGRRVRVYTVFGRESVYADESDAVLGDLAGMLPSDRVGSPEPAPMPVYGAPDPVHTP